MPPANADRVTSVTDRKGILWQEAANTVTLVTVLHGNSFPQIPCLATGFERVLDNNLRSALLNAWLQIFALLFMLRVFCFVLGVYLGFVVSQ